MRSKLFWLGAVLLALIPVLVIDISIHSIDWQKDVREDIINVAQNVYQLNREQKAAVLDKVFETNKTIVTLVYIKGLLILVCFGLGVYFIRRYFKMEKPRLWLTIIGCMLLMACFTIIRLYLPELNSADKVKYLSLAPNEYSLSRLYHENFKGKIVYVDFWGTTCGPCLDEFRNFTQPIKDNYKSRNDIAYLYICVGNNYLWKEQIKRYNVKGYHVFVNSDQYKKLYCQSVSDPNVRVTMPRYVIMNKSGKIVVKDAKRPSDGATLYAQIDKYLINR